MNLTFDEKMILAEVSKPVPEKWAVLNRLDHIQTKDFKTAKIISVLRDKLAAADEQTVFVAILAAQTEEIDIECMMTDDDSILSQMPTEDLLASVTGGDPEQYRCELQKYGFVGFLRRLEKMDYPEDVKEKLREILDAIE